MRAFIKLIRKFSPDIVYSPHKKEKDRDHRNCNDIISEALWMAGVDVYLEEGAKLKKEIFLKILFAGIFTLMALAALYYFLPLAEIGRGILFIAVCISVVLQNSLKRFRGSPALRPFTGRTGCGGPPSPPNKFS